MTWRKSVRESKFSNYFTYSCFILLLLKFPALAKVACTGIYNHPLLYRLPSLFFAPQGCAQSSQFCPNPLLSKHSIVTSTSSCVFCLYYFLFCFILLAIFSCVFFLISPKDHGGNRTSFWAMVMVLLWYLVLGNDQKNAVIGNNVRK